MTTQFLKKSTFTKVITFLIIANFILTSGPAGYCSRALAADSLRGETSATSGAVPPIKNDLRNSRLKDGGNPYVVTYDDKRAEKKETAGGKCAQLAWASNRGIPNPIGFNISVDAVRAYYNYNPKLIEMIKEARNLDITDAKARSAMSLKIQTFMMKETKLPPEVLNAVREQLIKMSRILGYEDWMKVAWAFRGSGIIEDFEGAIAWFKKTIGAQPGQGTTLLNKSGSEAELSIIEVIAGLFNDQIFVYRDVQIFFDFVSKMKDVSEYHKLIQLSEKYGFAVAATRLRNESSPGYVNLRKMIEVIESQEAGIKEQYKWSEKLEKSANDILEPMNFVTGIAVLEMCDSLFSGTGFTSQMGTGFDGSTYAKITKGLFPQKKGDSFQGYTRYVKMNLGPGLGPGIVEGKFEPNIVTYFDISGKGDWVPFEFSVGKKHMSLVYIEKVIKSLEPKFNKEQIYRLAKLYAEWQSPGKQEEVRAALRKEFNIDAERWIRSMMDLWYFFGKPDKYKATAREKKILSERLNVTEDEFFTLSYLVKHINKVATSYDTASYMLTSPEIANSRLLTDEGYKKLADMIAKVGNLMAQERFEAGDKGWRERRDIEFSVVRCQENDQSQYKVKLEHIYDLVTGEDLGPGWVKIVHLQNRPINPEKEIQDPDNIVFEKWKVDDTFLESNNIQPVAKGGLTGYSAAKGVLYFVDPYRDLAEQEEEIGKMKDKGIDVIVVLEEMGPEHDPIVEKAGAAIVWRGNDTSHAYIFSLELKIPIVINAAIQPGMEEYFKHEIEAVIDGTGGMIYIQPGAKGGLAGYGKAKGVLYLVDSKRTLTEQEEEVVRMRAQGMVKDPDFKVIVVLEEMSPEHDRIVEKAGAAIVWRGNTDTSHAYRFSQAFKIPMVINAAIQSGMEESLRSGMEVIIDGTKGIVYCKNQRIPLLRDDLIIRVDMVPDTKVGAIVSTMQSAQEVARAGMKNYLARIEFLINNIIKIYPQTGWAYDLISRLDKGEITEKDLTPQELEDVKILRDNPTVIEEIKKTIIGFPSAMEFIAEKMRYASNSLGGVFPLLDEIRAYDNKEKEALLYGLIGAKLYLRYDDSNPEFDSPLIGMRGSALMSHPHLKKGFLALNRGVVRSIKDGFKNNEFFFVYLRDSESEFRTQLADFEKICDEEGAYPEELATMIELGGNIWDIMRIAAIMNEFVAKHKKDGVKGWHVSIGTNDLTNSLGGTSREDKDFTGELLISHPALINLDPAKGKIELVPGYSYGPKEKGKPFTITINDEAAPGVLRFVEYIAAVVKAAGGKVYVCGQGPTKLFNKGDVIAGMRYLNITDGDGTQSITFTGLAMLDYDARASLVRVAEGTLAGKTPVATLSNIKKEAENAVITSEALVIEKPEDILKLREKGKRQKIAILKAVWERKELEEMGIPWDYLNYAGAILLDEKVKPGTGILAENGVKSRVKAQLTGGQDIVSGEPLTIVYGKNAVYKGTLPTYVEELKLTPLRMPKEGLVPETRSITRISASDLFERRDNNPAAIDIHPLAFVLYKDNPSSLPKDVYEAVKNLIGNKDPLEYLQGRFTEYVTSKTEEAIKNNKIPVYTVFRLTRNQMRYLKGGEAIEKSKGREGPNFDDPRSRLQGGARALRDFWPIFDREIAAFKDVKAVNSKLALQLSAMGTRSQEIIEMQLRVLKSSGITSQNQDIGLELTTSLDPLQLEDYIKQGIKFFSYRDRELAEAILAANLNHPDMFVVEGKEAMARRKLEAPLAYVRGIIAENKERGVWLGLNPGQTIGETKAPVAPVGFTPTPAVPPVTPTPAGLPAPVIIPLGGDLRPGDIPSIGGHLSVPDKMGPALLNFLNIAEKNGTPGGGSQDADNFIPIINQYTEKDLKGKKALIRVDLNVSDEMGKIKSDNRLVEALPTLTYLMKNGATVILLSHNGRPDGKVKPELSMGPVAQRLTELLAPAGINVVFHPGSITEQGLTPGIKITEGAINVLENTRFYKGEEKNDPVFAKALAGLADNYLYVFDAFGTAERLHASTGGAASFMENIAIGYLMEKENKYLQDALAKLSGLIIGGGPKVQEKLPVVEHVIPNIKSGGFIIIGTGPVAAFLKELYGIEIGQKASADDMENARKIIKLAKEKNVTLVLPIDFVAVDTDLSAIAENGKSWLDLKKIPEWASTYHVTLGKLQAGKFTHDGKEVSAKNLYVYDIGESTQNLFDEEILKTAKDRAVFYNGMVGVEEIPYFAFGTKALSKTLVKATEKGILTIVAGGDTTKSAEKNKIDKLVTHTSTGGGASAAVLKGDKLQVIDALEKIQANIVMAQRLNVKPQDVGGYVSADKAIHNATGGEAFDNLVNDLFTGTIADKKIRAIIIDPSSFKAGGVKSALEKVAKLSQAVKIAMYGEKAQNLAALLGNKDIITGNTLDDVLRELAKQGIAREDTFLLKSSAEPVIGAQVRVISGDINTIIMAKALKELLNNKAADDAFARFYQNLAKQGVISEKTYNDTRDSMLAKLQEAIFALPSDLTLTAQATKETEKKVTEEFLIKIGV